MTATTLCRGCGNYTDTPEELRPTTGVDVPVCPSCRATDPLPPGLARLADALRSAFAGVDHGTSPVTVTDAHGAVIYRGPLAGMDAALEADR